MNELLRTVLGNAVVVACGAALVLAGARWMARKPALLHACWLLLLIKLITPPLFEWRIAVERPAEEPPGVETTAEAEDLALSPEELDFIASMLARSEEESPGTADDVAPAPLPAVVPEPITARDSIVEPLRTTFPWMRALLALWTAGALWATWRAARRVVALRRLLRVTQPAPPHLVGRLERAGSRLGLSRLPELRVLDARISPFLATRARRAVMVLPLGVVESLGRRELETLIIHELAHYARRDHFVRWLELLTEIVHWWNPVAYLVRRELRRAEEECCDAWVVDSLRGSGKSYAKALLACIDHMSGAESRVPAATAVGRLASLERRVTMIMEGKTSGRLARSSRASLLLAALLLLPVAPTLAQTLDLAPESPLAEEAMPAEVPEPVKHDERSDLKKLSRIIDRLADRGMTEVARELAAIRDRMASRAKRRHHERARAEEMRAHAEMIQRQAELQRLEAEHIMRQRELDRLAEVDERRLRRHENAAREGELHNRVARLEQGLDEMKAYFERLIAMRQMEDNRERQRLADRAREAEVMRRHDLQRKLDELEVVAAELETELSVTKDQIAALTHTGDLAAAERAQRRAVDLETKLADIRNHAEVLKRGGKKEPRRRDAKRLAEIAELERRIAELEDAARQHADRGESEAARERLTELSRMKEYLHQLDPVRTRRKSAR